MNSIVSLALDNLVSPVILSFVLGVVAALYLREYAKQGSPFAEAFADWIERDWDRSIYKEPDEVAEAAVHAMFADEPMRRYMVVPKEEEAGWTIGKQIEELVQLNEWQEYSYTRDELVQMLDAALAGDDEGE